MRQGDNMSGGTRSNALWGRGGRRVGVLVATVSAVLVAVSGAAGAPVSPPSASAAQTALIKTMSSRIHAYIPDALLSAAQLSPKQSFDVILQGSRKERSGNFFKKAFADSSSNGQAVATTQVRRQFTAIDGGRVTLTGWQILALGMSRNVTAIVPNDTVEPAVDGPSPRLELREVGLVDGRGGRLDVAGPLAAGARRSQSSTPASMPRAPTSTGRVIGQTSLASSLPNGPGDTYGHGTSSPASPRAPRRVMPASRRTLTSSRST